jgi:isopenicillin-N N-acyltransferase-like protein
LPLCLLKEIGELKTAKRFTVVEMDGTHFEMGRQYGTQCKRLIRRLVKAFDGLILEAKNIQQGRQVAREAVAHVREWAPELIEEVEGIAAGAGVDFDDVFRVNCSVELFAWQGCLQHAEVSTVPKECSSFAVLAREGPIAAWNMDWWRLWLP